ncbi:OB-fold protein [Gemmata sp.]|uniref:OB-fold protein n=1 Tax=Gemmata sp. TaxID=1914242 RepID=UPI003F71BAF2
MNPHDEFDDREPPRPRRNRHDAYGDDRSRRGWEPEPPAQTSVVGIIGLVAGTAGLTISFIPCIGVVGMVGGGIGLGLALLGVLESRNSAGRVSMGVPIAGAAVSTAALLVGGFWLALMTGAFRDNQRQQADPPPIPPGDTPIVVPAADLDREYDANEFDADRKYRDKQVEITGRVKRVADDVTPGRVTLVLNGLPATSVNCVFPLTEKPNLAVLEPGDEVVIRGRCKGKLKNSVTLEDCRRVLNDREQEARDAPPTIILADVLVSEYADVAAADRKYKGRALVVTGHLGPIIRRAGTATVSLQDDDGNDLLKCEFAAEEAKHLTRLKAGQRVTLRGRCRGKIDDTLTLTQCSVAK